MPSPATALAPCGKQYGRYVFFCSMAPAKMSMQKKHPNGRIMSIGPRYALSTTLLSSLPHGTAPDS